LNREPRKYHPEKLQEILEQNPDAYLFEIAGHFENGTISGVSDALIRANITLKKRRKSTKSDVKPGEPNIKNKRKTFRLLRGST